MLLAFYFSQFSVFTGSGFTLTSFLPMNCIENHFENNPSENFRTIAQTVTIDRNQLLYIHVCALYVHILTSASSKISSTKLLMNVKCWRREHFSLVKQRVNILQLLNEKASWNFTVFNVSAVFYTISYLNLSTIELIEFEVLFLKKARRGKRSNLSWVLLVLLPSRFLHMQNHKLSLLQDYSLKKRKVGKFMSAIISLDNFPLKRFIKNFFLK